MMSNATSVYLDPSRPVEERAADLVARMTLEEKIGQMVYAAPAIERLGVPAYNWWNEALHGVARAGIATVFPQAIGLAASFDEELLLRVATAISDEARAKHHEFARRGSRDIYQGLTFWSPNINLFRDPRWGRGQETYGEDPYLTARMGVAFCKGLQGDDPHYLKTIATPKHYAVHSGPEPLRHTFNAVVSEKDLRETYLFAFAACVREAKAHSIMGAYNRTNGEPCCASPTLLQKILREQWGFEGYVVSDCGAIDDLHTHHRVTNSAEESAALAVKHGCDLNCGRTYDALLGAVQQGLITEAELDVSVRRLMAARIRLGLFDPPEQVPYANIPYEVNACDEHRALARAMAQASIVLLKNDGLLPLTKERLKTIAVIGPNADDRQVLRGNYCGMPLQHVTALDGIRAAVGPNIRVLYALGCDHATTQGTPWTGSATRGFAEALAAAARADVVVMCLGLSPNLEGEEGATQSEAGGDKTSLDLPGLQEKLLQAVCATGKPVVLVLFNGSPVSVNWAHDHVPAILEAWYPGEQGGHAIADVLFGDVNPGGRLPLTFYRSLDQVPPFTDYAMRGRTYRYFKGEPLYPFGYGLSYTEFSYSSLYLSADRLPTGEPLQVRLEVANLGNLEGDEVVQLYLQDREASVEVPQWSLQGFQRVHLQPGERRPLEFTLTARQMALIDEQGRCILEPGRFRVYVGGQQPGPRSRALTGKTVMAAEFEVVGETMEMEY